MKEPTIVQHSQQQQSHHGGVVRKSSPDLNNNGAHGNHSFHAYNYVPSQSLIDSDYNSDGTPTMRLYMYSPHASTIAIPTSSAVSAQPSAGNTPNTTTANTIDEVIADTLKDEHNASGAVSNSNDDDTAQYLSLTSANEMSERWARYVFILVFGHYLDRLPMTNIFFGKR